MVHIKKLLKKNETENEFLSYRVIKSYSLGLSSLLGRSHSVRNYFLTKQKSLEMVRTVTK